MFSAIYEEKGILKKILNEILKNSFILSWIADEKECTTHRLFVLELMIRSKIYFKTNKILIKLPKNDVIKETEKKGRKCTKNSQAFNKLRILKNK